MKAKMAALDVWNRDYSGPATINRISWEATP
jgi:hypothetical protein